MPLSSDAGSAVSTTNSDIWFKTPLGQYVQQAELAWFANTLSRLPSFRVVQLGWPTHNLMADCPAKHRNLLCMNHPVDAFARPEMLPLPSNSVDVLILPHTLDFCLDPQHVLREAVRVLVPNGRLLFSSFNPSSLWGLRRLGRRNTAPWFGHFLRLSTLKDWLSLLSLDVHTGQMMCYRPPCKGMRMLARFKWLEAAGDRWWPSLGAVYCLEAKKTVLGLRLRSAFNTQGAESELLVPASARLQTAHKKTLSRKNNE